MTAMLNLFDQGKTIDEVYAELYPNEIKAGRIDHRAYIQEVFNNRAWYEERLLAAAPGSRRRMYSE